MKNHHPISYWFKVSLGLVSLIAAFVCVAVTIAETDSDKLRPLSQFALQHKQQAKLDVPAAGRVKDDDPIFARISTVNGNEFKLVGMVRCVELNSDPLTKTAYIDWSDSSIIPKSNAQWEIHESPKTLEWVLNLMLPPQKRQVLVHDLFARIDARQDVLIADLEPLLVNSLRDLTPVLRDRFEQSIRNQRPEISELVVRYQTEIFEKKFIPLAKTEILPIVVRQSSPLLNDVGKQIFAKASVWRFGWRALYDVSPLPDRDLVAGEFRRFAKKNAIPIIEQHTDEIVETLTQTSVEIARNPKVKTLIRESAAEVFKDPEFRKIIGQTFEDVFSDVDELTEVIRLRWSGTRGQRFKENLKECIEPWFNKFGAEIFGTPQGGLTPEFVAVLRTQVFEKDRRWITVDCHFGTDRLADSYTAICSESDERFPANGIGINQSRSGVIAETPNAQ